MGDTVPYSISVTNSGIAPINNVVLSDPIPAGSSFVPGSVVVDGTPLPGGESLPMVLLWAPWPRAHRSWSPSTLLSTRCLIRPRSATRLR
ncbi:DUF11 domain-containing protein [Paenibacillus rhizoplanae]